jgi:hypothetical protein
MTGGEFTWLALTGWSFSISRFSHHACISVLQIIMQQMTLKNLKKESPLKT